MISDGHLPLASELVLASAVRILCFTLQLYNDIQSVSNHGVQKSFSLSGTVQCSLLVVAVVAGT